jgi:methionyl-tRNA formyltransferase
MRIVFFGTSEVGIPILEALMKEHEVVQVITSPDAPVGRKQELQATPIANLANFLKIPVQKPEKVKDNPEFLEFLKTIGADIFIVVSYGKILPAALLDIPRLKTLNVHFSMLPKYRGAAPIQYALLNGEKVTGTSIFILDEQVDHGPILIQKEFYIEPNDTFTTLAAKLADLSAQLLINILPQYEVGVINPQEQNHDSATFTKLIKKEHGRIDWTKPAQEIFNQWRAFTPWPGIWTTWQGQTFKILTAEVATSVEESQARENVPCGDNTSLHLLEVQPAGKNAMSIKDFLNGQKEFKPQDLI